MSTPPPLDPLAGLSDMLASAGVRVDPQRQGRSGVPEVVLAANKTAAATLKSVRRLLAESASGRVLVSRLPEAMAEGLTEALEKDGFAVEFAADCRLLLAARADAGPPVPTGGVVAVLTAGASDAAVADEATWVAREMGCSTVRADDVGVAGIHRLVEPLRELRDAEADVVIVAAGMDGALPSVVAGLVDIPVIGLPVSTGYGLGGNGVAALMSMLQTCAPGLAVVNIDNGVGAGAMAALIANRAASGRSRP